MEYFRQTLLLRITLFISVVLQFSLLDAHNNSLPSQISTETVTSIADSVQEEAGDNLISLQRTRLVKTCRSRISPSRQGVQCNSHSYIADLFTILHNKWFLHEHVSLRALFCIFRI